MPIAPAGRSTDPTTSPVALSRAIRRGTPSLPPALLQLPLATVDAPQQVREGAGFGSLFFSPGLGETLRINGRVQWLRDGVIGIAVSECYLHCAKALMRSAFWEGGAERPDDTSPLALSPFLVTATMHRDGSVDVSPKGDPAGAMLQLHDDRIWFADRPGNRRMPGLVGAHASG